MRVTLLTLSVFAMMATCVLFAGTNLHAAIVPVQLSNADEESEKSDEAIEGVSNWEIDNEHTSVVCAVSHFGLSYVYGRFNRCSGSVEMDFQQPDSAKFRFEVDSSSVDTNDASRDDKLRGSDCLDAALYETITFESISVKAKDVPQAGGKTKRTFLVMGNLTMRGETRKIDIPVELLAMGKGADKKLRCGFMSKFVVRRSDFGLDAMADTVGDSVAVTFCFQAIRKTDVADEKSIFERDSDADADDKSNELEELFRKNGTEDDKDDDKSETRTELDELNLLLNYR